MEKNADLSAFSKALDEKIEMLKPQKTIDRIKAFHEAVIAAATETVPKTAPGKKPTCHLSASVKAQIKTRNRLRRSIGTNRKEWIEACRGVRQKIEEERQKLGVICSRNRIQLRPKQAVESVPCHW